MQWIISNDLPVHNQLVEELKLRIFLNFYRAGEKMPSVRDLSFEAKVNPNTMQKALTKLEEEGYMYTERTSGRYITQDSALIKRLKAVLPHTVTEKYVQAMIDSGIEAADIPAYVQNYVERMKKS